jgi:hypothetical protein
MGKRRTSIMDIDRSLTRSRPPRHSAQALGALQRLARDGVRPPAPRTVAHAATFDHGAPVRAELRAPAPPPVASSRSAAAPQLRLPTAPTPGAQTGAAWAVPLAVSRSLAADNAAAAHGGAPADEAYAAGYVEPFDAPAPPQATVPTRPDAVSSRSAAAPLRPAAATTADAADSAPPPMAGPDVDEELDVIRNAGRSAERADAGQPVLNEPPFPPPAAPAEETPAAEAPVAVAASSHDVFERMGRGMRYANTFDLGAIALSRRFDEFDAELAEEPAAGSQPPAPAPDVDEAPAIPTDDDADEDLRTIGALLRMRQGAESDGAGPASAAPPSPEPAAPSAPEPAPEPAAPSTATTDAEAIDVPLEEDTKP